MIPDGVIHTSFSQDFDPFVVDVIKLDFFQAAFEFVTHLIHILQSLHGKKGMNGRFESFPFMNGFQDSYHPEFFPIMIGYFFFEILSFPFKKFGLGGYGIDVHYFRITHGKRMKKFWSVFSIYLWFSLVRLGDGSGRKRVVVATYLSERIEWSRFAYSSRRGRPRNNFYL